jgi:hypothetical protein
MASPARILVTVHGIRTFGQWQDRLRKLTLAANPDILVENYGYGYFSVIAFVIPLFRWLAVRSFRNNLKALMRAHEGASFTFVAHSFGTHLVAHALRGMKPDERPDVELIILSGSVLRSAFDWTSLMNPAPGTPGIRRVINDCGLNDSVLIMSQAGVLFTGMAGRVGFYGFTGADLVNRFFPGGHSHYFMPPGDDPDAFMKRYWVPVLAAGEAALPGLEIPVAGTLKGIQYALYRIADPIKLALYGLLAFILINYAYLQPRAEARLEQARREYLAAAAQMASSRTLPDAFATLSSIFQRGLLTSGTDRDRALTLATFSLQRLVPASTALEGIADGSLFGWGDFSYLKSGGPLRIAIENPLAAIGDDTTRKLVALDRNSTLMFIEAQTGRILQQHRADPEGDINSPVLFERLKEARGRYLVTFGTEAPNQDEDNAWVFSLDLVRNTIDLAKPGLTPTEDCADFVKLANLDPDDDDRTMSQEERQRIDAEKERRRQVEKRCLIPISSDQAAVRFLAFPSARSEAFLWKSKARPAAAADDSQTCPMIRPNFAFTLRADIDRLDFSGLPSTADEVSADDAKRAFVDQNDFGCFIDFIGAGGRHFIATMVVSGQWNFSWLICALKDDVAAEKCRFAGLNWDARSNFILSADKSRLAIAARGMPDMPAWLEMDLTSMTVRYPDIWANSRTIAMAYSGETLMTVSPARGVSGGVEIWAYGLDGTPTLEARRIFVAPEGLGLDEEQMRSTVERTALFESDGAIVLATPFQQLSALTLQDVSAIPRWLRLALTWLRWPVKTESLIASSWNTSETGLDPKGTVAFAISPRRNVLAIASGTSLRLFQTSDGRFLSDAIDLATLPGCTGPIETLAIADDLSVSATMAGCVAQRASPPGNAETEDRLANPEIYLGSGTPVDRRLPGERPATPP